MLPVSKGVVVANGAIPSGLAGLPVRRLLRGDAAVFRAIRLEGLENHPAAFTASFANERAQPLSRFEEQLESSFVLGAGAADRLVGVAGFYVEGAEKMRHRGTLWGMYVRDEARRSGLARNLIAGILTHARDRVEEVVLSVEAENAAAIACYEHAGFRVTARDNRAVKIGDAYFDMLQMKIRFAAG